MSPFSSSAAVCLLPAVMPCEISSVGCLKFANQKAKNKREQIKSFEAYLAHKIKQKRKKKGKKFMRFMSAS